MLSWSPHVPTQAWPNAMHCIGPTGPAFGITSPRLPKLAPARRRRASHWRRRASENKETAENARDDMLDDPDRRETNTLAATDRRRRQRTTGEHRLPTGRSDDRADQRCGSIWASL